MELMGLKLGAIVGSVVFALIGVLIFWLCFVIIDKLTPYDLWGEIIEKQNVALGVVVAAMSLGICIIVAAGHSRLMMVDVWFESQLKLVRLKSRCLPASLSSRLAGWFMSWRLGRWLRICWGTRFCSSPRLLAAICLPWAWGRGCLSFLTASCQRIFCGLSYLVALAGGLLPAILFLANAYIPGSFRWVLYGMVGIVGILVGLEIPLVMRILKRNVAFKDVVSQVLTFDYLGALAVSVAFPLILVPQLGLIRTGLLFGLLNAAVAVWALWLFRFELRQFKAHALACGLTLAALRQPLRAQTTSPPWQKTSFTKTASSSPPHRPTSALW